jgi:murein L,D-transpeptidase YcbB/YkuD
MKYIGRLICFLTICFSHLLYANEDIRQYIERWPGELVPSVQGESISNSSALNRYYTQNGFSLSWFENGKPTPQAVALANSIATIENEGLLAEDYHAKILSKLSTQTETDRAGYDLLLSDAFLNLSAHLQAGKVDPISLSNEWEANRRQGDLATVLTRVLRGGDVLTTLDSLRPRQIRYYRLKIALAKIRSMDSSNWTPLAESPAIKPGNVDSRLNEIRRRLVIWGDLSNQDDSLSPSYGGSLQAAVVGFQQRHGLDADGVIGKETIKAFNFSPRERAEQIIVNMERWRWLAEDLGDKHLLVNIAAFELKIIDNNETVFVKPVVVGRNFRKTPVFSNKIRYLVLNPTWTVPFRLATQDKLPDIQKDPGYLDKLGIQVFRGDNKEPIDPFSINWQTITKRNFPFRLVQKPGPQNALGQVKFMFPNSHDVYLHDTPSRELFKKSERAFSSGCIRVSDPLELAAFLLRNENWDRAKIDAAIASGITQTVNLKTPLPIHIEYWTAWVNSAGVLNFRNDIYQRDQPLWQAMRQPLIKVVH